MNPERWERIERIFQSALEIDSRERAAFLDHACADDHSLRSEVESLIAAHNQAGSFIASAPSANDQTILIEGREVGHYHVLSLIGRGGMGEVYLAEDTRLGRKVALKLLPSDFIKDDDRVRRFQREARAASSLNHPNIITVFDIGQSDRLHFIAAEFIDGPTFRALMGREELSRLIELLAQVADGLAKAHSSGIIHRDLKPENIMVTKDGFAKVLDFGLAKLIASPLPADDNRSEAATSPAETRPGILVGTVGYMSPEQAQGKAVDHRSDIFSFGCILYEAVTGRRPFEGDSTIEVLHKIIYDQPPAVSDFNSNCPTELQRIIRRCLVKDPDRRYHSIKDAAIDLREVVEECREFSSSGSRRAAEQAITKEMVRDTIIAEPMMSDHDPRVRQMTRFSGSGIALAILALAGAIIIWPAYRKAEVGSELKLEYPRAVALSKAREVAASLGYDATGLKEHAYFEATDQVLRLVAAGQGVEEARRFAREGRAAVWNVTFARPDKAVFYSLPLNLDAGEITVSISPRGQLISFSAAPPSGDTDAPPEQAQATSIAAETIQRILSVDLSGYELESFSKSDSSRTVEIVWKNRSPAFGLAEIVRVFLKGTKITAINHSLRPPPSTELRSEADRSSSLDRYQGMVGGMIFLAFYALGVFFLVKGKRWNALLRRLPIIACILEASWMLAGTISIFRHEIGADLILLTATLVLITEMAFFPGYAGLFELLRRWNPIRLYGAEEMARGR
ncbi:MAG: serine/threonine-protein kinase, partial [Acidobacteriota bacterium]